MWVVCIESSKKSTLIMRFTAIVNYNLQKKLVQGASIVNTLSS